MTLIGEPRPCQGPLGRKCFVVCPECVDLPTADPKPDWAVEAAEQVFVKGWEGGEPFIKYIAEGYRDLQAKHEAEVARLKTEIRQLREATDMAINRLEMMCDKAWNGDARDFKRSLFGVFSEYRAALQEKEDGPCR